MHRPLNVKCMVVSHLSKHVGDIVPLSMYTLLIKQELFITPQNYIFIPSSCTGVLNTCCQMEICYRYCNP